MNICMKIGEPFHQVFYDEDCKKCGIMRCPIRGIMYDLWKLRDDIEKGILVVNKV